MTLLVFGKTGQVARELQVLAPDARYVGRDEVDLAKPAQVAAFLKSTPADAIINAAAYTAVDQAEADRDLAMAINGASVGTMAEHAAATGIPFVHISTDYVFDGQGDQPFAPDTTPAPLSVYGQSKLGGEALIWNAGGTHAILRTSWVFSAHGNNFLKTMLMLGDKLDELTVIDDQIGGPTPASGIAAACLSIVQKLREDKSKSGTYHYSGAPDASWFDFAQTIFEASGQGVTLKRTQTAVFEADWHDKNPGKPRANRPLNSRLDCASLETNFGITRPDWRAVTKEIVKGLRA